MERFETQVVYEGEPEYRHMGARTTVCLVQLANGFEVVGTSCCVRDEDFDFELGKKYALADATRRAQEYLAYAAREAYHQGKKA